MSIIKSFNVGTGDMFYIKHNSSNFSIIDCCLSEDNKEIILDEIVSEKSGKEITRFISTHPDEDHFHGLKDLDEKIDILNFYCVKNQVTKTDETDDFKRYCELRDSEKAFYIYKNCSRKWMNENSEERGSSGINIKWPSLENEDFKSELEKVKNGESPNNISPIVTYSLEDGVTVMWMGDIEKDFLDKIKDELDLPKAHILFAPHHGRDSGKIPKDILDDIEPEIIIIGEAPSEDLNYYDSYNTITQNSAGNITFDCIGSKVHIYVSNEDYEVDFLDEERVNALDYYIGTLNL